jgi:cellulose synthase (UDP-forming)
MPIPIIPHQATWSLANRSVIHSPFWSGLINQIPLVYIEPVPGDSHLLSEKDIDLFLRSILKGKRDGALDQFFRAIKNYNRPLMVSFMPEFDNPLKPWGIQQEQTLNLYRRAWQYIVRFGNEHQVNNATWIWCPVYPSSLVGYYPGDKYVDWLGFVIVDNPVVAPDRKSHSFCRPLSTPFVTVRMHESYGIRQKPILITRLGSEIGGQQARSWTTEAIEAIQTHYPQIRGILFADKQTCVCTTIS